MTSFNRFDRAAGIEPLRLQYEYRRRVPYRSTGFWPFQRPRQRYTKTHVVFDGILVVSFSILAFACIFLDQRFWCGAIIVLAIAQLGFYLRGYYFWQKSKYDDAHILLFRPVIHYGPRPWHRGAPIKLGRPREDVDWKRDGF